MLRRALDVPLAGGTSRRPGEGILTTSRPPDSDVCLRRRRQQQQQQQNLRAGLSPQYQRPARGTRLHQQVFRLSRSIAVYAPPKNKTSSASESKISFVAKAVRCCYLSQEGLGWGQRCGARPIAPPAATRQQTAKSRCPPLKGRAFLLSGENGACP